MEDIKMANKVLGIDLGTTYSCVAYVDDNGKPVVLKNEENEFTTPSVVGYSEGENTVVGSQVKEDVEMYDKVVSFVKRHMGESGYTEDILGVPTKPEEVSAAILSKVVKDAQTQLRDEGVLEEDEVIKDVVITCPAYFGEVEKEATKQAGIIAGLNVLAIIPEPTAAAISYGSTRSDENKNILVYDLGGGTFDITLIHIEPGKIQSVCVGGNHSLGGKDWDELFRNYVATVFENETGISGLLEDEIARESLQVVCEKQKKILTNKQKVTVPVRYDVEKINVEVTREKFDELTKPKLDSTISLTMDMLSHDAAAKGYSIDSISDILLVGGSTYMPQIMERVKAEFPNCNVKRFDPDAAVAKGAAIFAQQKDEYNKMINSGLEMIFDEGSKDLSEEEKEQIEEEVKSGTKTLGEVAEELDISKEVVKKLLPEDEEIVPLNIINVTSRSYGTAAYDSDDIERIFQLIKKNTELPATGTDYFYPRRDNLKTVKITIYESLSSDYKIELTEGKVIGNAVLQLPPNCPKENKITVNMIFDDSGILHLFASEEMSGGSVKADFEVVGGMSQQEIEEAKDRLNH